MSELPAIAGPFPLGADVLEAKIAASAIGEFLSTHPLPLGDEKILQAAIAAAFEQHDIVAEREKRLSPSDILDFFIEGVGVEVKIKGGRHAIYRQCERYCLHDCVKALVLATNIPMALPGAINGKPCIVASLGKGWL